MPISRRATAINVADDDIFTLHSHRFDHLREQLTSAADERFALQIFIGAGGFTDEHQPRFVISMGVHNLRTTRTQTATCALADVAPDIFQSLVRDRH